MTLIIAAKGEKYIVVAADKRGVQEDAQRNRMLTNFHNKLVRLNTNNCVLIAGNAEKGTFLTEKLKLIIKDKDDINTILSKFCKLCRSNYEVVYKFVKPELYPGVTFILAGFENIKNKPKRPRIYVIRDSDAFEEGEKPDYIIEGKTLIADYIFSKGYEMTLSQDDMTNLVFNCIYDTELYDGDVGGTPDIEVITELGFNVVDTNRMKIERQDEEQNKKFKKIIEGN